MGKELRETTSDASVSRLARLIQLVDLLDVGANRNANQLAEAMKVSRRTVFRDIQTLQDAGVPIQFDSSKMCYFLQRAVDVHARLPVPDLLETAMFIRSSLQAGKGSVAAYFESEVLHRLTSNSRELMVHALDWIVPNDSGIKTVNFDLLKTLFACYVKRKKARVTYIRSEGGHQCSLFAPSQLSVSFDGIEIIGWSSFHCTNIGLPLNRINTAMETEEDFVRPDRRIGTWQSD